VEGRGGEMWPVVNESTKSKKLNRKNCFENCK